MEIRGDELTRVGIGHVNGFDGTWELLLKRTCAGLKQEQVALRCVPHMIVVDRGHDLDLASRIIDHRVWPKSVRQG
jgi:hypothetical protein